MSFSKKLFRGVMVCLLVSLMTNAASAVLVALTENVNTGYYKSTFDSVPFSMATFAGAIAPTFSATDDTYFVTNGAAEYTVHGAQTTFTTANGSTSLIKFDLSSIPAGATINEAKLQFFARGGNAAARPLGAIQHQTWGEAKATAAGPDVVSPDRGWGAAGNTLWDFATDVGPTTNMLAEDAGSPGVYPFDKFLLADVTSDLQSFVTGTNYGWGMQTGNWSKQASEGLDKERPVLFVDYTASAVPEPSAFLMVGLVFGLGWLKKRGR